MSTLEKKLDLRGVCRLYIHRPLDTYDDALMEDLHEALTWCRADRRVRVVVIASGGLAFASGPDAAWLGRIIDYDYASNLVDATGLARVLYQLYHMGKPTIARVHGKALGFGVGLIAACDMAVADYDVKFQITDVRIGLVPSLIAPYLVKAIGSRHALRYLLSGERFDSVDAQRMGLVQEVVPREELDRSIEGMIEEYLKGAPRAMAATKEIVRLIEQVPIDEGVMDVTVQKASERRSSREGLDGVASYLEKRKPFWSEGE